MNFREDGVNGSPGVTQIGTHHQGPVLGGVNMGDEDAGGGNAVGLYGSATGVGSSVRAVGDDTNIDLRVRPKGSGVVDLSVNTDSTAVGVKVTKLVDTNSVNRLVPNPTAKTITDTGATALFDVACASNTVASGSLFYSIFATDSTDFQCQNGLVQYAMVNKGGSFTTSIVEDSTAFASALSTGTLTRAWTIATATGKGTVSLQPTGSLTETTFNIMYTVVPNRGAVTIL